MAPTPSSGVKKPPRKPPNRASKLKPTLSPQAENFHSASSPPSSEDPIALGPPQGPSGLSLAGLPPSSPPAPSPSPQQTPRQQTSPLPPATPKPVKLADISPSGNASEGSSHPSPTPKHPSQVSRSWDEEVEEEMAAKAFFQTEVINTTPNIVAALGKVSH